MINFEYRQLEDLLYGTGNIVITAHHNPDGDAIGSALALYNFFLAQHKQATVITPNDYPSFLKWLPGNDKVIIFEKESVKATKLLKEADLIFCLDYNAISRVGNMQDVLSKAPGKKFLIDHHLDPELADFDYYYSLVKTSSTAELIFHFIENMGKSDLIDKSIAECIFVGIMTDTGSFSHAVGNAGTFEIVGKLINKGLIPDVVHNLVYDTFSEKRLRLLGYCLENKMTLLPESDAAYIALSKEELEKYDYQIGDTEGVVNYPLSIEGIKIAVLLTERTNRIRLSFRSKGKTSVNEIAREHFGGGGHMNAAGGDSFESLENTIQKLEEVLKQYKAANDRSPM